MQQQRRQQQQQQRQKRKESSRPLARPGLAWLVCPGRLTDGQVYMKAARPSQMAA
jgi:hypothetical protein